MRGCVLDGKVTFPDGRPHLPRWPTKDGKPPGSCGQSTSRRSPPAPLAFARADLRELPRHATQVKNICVPYGA
jgi:hypothetical protein